MLSNQVQLKQSVNEPKRDTSVNNSTANSDDRKFEDAMHYSRQQQLMAEQRQQAARNDQIRQQQRRETEQLQTAQQQSSQQGSNQQAQSRVERNSTEHKNDAGEANKTSVSDKTKEQARETKDDNTQEQTRFSSEHQKDEASASVQTKAQSSNDALESENTADKAASTSWLDTVMKIVEGQEQDTSENFEGSDAKSHSKSNDLAINSLQKSTTEHATGDDSDKALSDAQLSEIRQLFSELNKADQQSSTTTELLSEDSIESSSELTDGEKQLASLTGLLAEQANNSQLPTGDNIELELDEGSVKVSGGLDTEPNITAKAVSDALGLTVKNSSEVDVNLDEAAQKAQVLASIQQLQAQQNQASTSKADSLLANTKPVNTVLNFANPNLQGLIKTNQSPEGANLTFDLDGELPDEQLNSIEPGKSNERNLDTQLKSLLEARSSLLTTSPQDITSKANEAGLKDVVDVNGVQLDKNLQLPKLEHITQNKNETLLRENILFNKQELANHMQQQIGLMMSKNMKSIDIRLDPPELGAMQIKLSMNNEQASVSFVVSNQQAKDALDASLPKLREMLEQEGMDLAESDVQQGSGNNADADSDDNQDSDNNGHSLANDDGQDDANLIAQDKLNRAINSPWNVDYYA